jgi:hypothetical protein
MVVEWAAWPYPKPRRPTPGVSVVKRKELPCSDKKRFLVSRKQSSRLQHSNSPATRASAPLAGGRRWFGAAVAPIEVRLPLPLPSSLPSSLSISNTESPVCTLVLVAFVVLDSCRTVCRTMAQVCLNPDP